MENSITIKSWKSWFLAARPKTLTAAFAPVIVSYFLAKQQGFNPEWTLALFALLSSLCIQIATNLINDALDFKKGADTDLRIGPMRVTQSKLLNSKQVFMGGLLFFALATLFAVPLIVKAGWIIALMLLISIISGYIYTGGPYPLAYIGLGEVFVVLFFGLFSTSIFYYIQTMEFNRFTLLAGLQIGLLCTVMIAINNLRDMEQDKKVDKKTLAVRFGERFSKFEISFLIYTPFFLSIAWIYYGLYFAALLPFTTVLFGHQLLKYIWKTSPSPMYNTFLAFSALLHLMFSLLLCIGLIL